MNDAARGPAPTRVDRFRGVLLGTMLGDALGMPLEGRALTPAEADPVREMRDARLGRGTYTDDTQMAMALAEALLASREPCRPELDDVARAFARAYGRDGAQRGYGANTSRILEAISRGESWRSVVDRYRLPGGSFANGAAMRVAPVALGCFPDVSAAARLAEEQGRTTGHTHPLARFGARLQAVAVAETLGRAAGEDPPAAASLGEAAGMAPPEAFGRALDWIDGHRDASPREAARRLGTGLRASRSVPAALWCFLSRPDDPEAAVVRAVNLGGDADTIGAMTGALAGARHGAAAFPERWVGTLEDGAWGRSHALALASRLYERVEKA